MEEYVERLRLVFAQLRRVLAADGTGWLNLGDTYSTGRSGAGDARRAGHRRPLPAKNLVGVPWRVALALQEDGWILRSSSRAPSWL